ncbi:hypothetical protein KY328_01505, partial [Candidatus Woesearchaeota archaeon]|nr:hypothetical protein [Candidatus Woesearchaeota archaeon]
MKYLIIAIILASILVISGCSGCLGVDLYANAATADEILVTCSGKYGTDLSKVEHCIKDAAIKAVNLKACADITTKERRAKCKLGIAKVTKDPNICKDSDLYMVYGYQDIKADDCAKAVRGVMKCGGLLGACCDSGRLGYICNAGLKCDDNFRCRTTQQVTCGKLGIGCCSDKEYLSQCDPELR